MQDPFVKAETPSADFGQKVYLNIADFLVDFLVDSFLLFFPKENGLRNPQKTQTPQSTSHFREGVKWRSLSQRPRHVWPEIKEKQGLSAVPSS